MNLPAPSLAALAPSLTRLDGPDRDRDGSDYAALRAAALAWSQAASGHRWTDYNLHDPGLTLLEAYCYALTEIGYRVDFPVADHLARPDGRIDGRRQGLFAAPDIFPSPATNAADICRIVLDAHSAIVDVQIATETPGLHRLMILTEAVHGDGGPVALDPAVAAALATAYRAHRGLGEDLDEEITHIPIETCQLVLDAELAGTRDPAKVLAEIFAACDRLISPRLRVESRIALKAAGATLEDIYSGPLTQAGIIALASASDGGGSISASELREAILTVPGVTLVHSVGIALDERRTARSGLTWDGQALRWQAGGDAGKALPKLCTPQVDPVRALERITLRHRTGTPVAGSAAPDGRRAVAIRVDPAYCAERFDDIRAARSHAGKRDTGAEFSGAELPPGTPTSPPPYRTLGNLLPPAYGLSEPLPADPRKDPPLPDQLAAYVALFDQFLANSGGLVDHLGDLFAIRVRDEHGALVPSHWPQILTDSHIPGIEQLYARADAIRARPGATAALPEPGPGTWPDRVRWDVFDRSDRVYQRRQRVLDFLLALYGEHLDQNTFGQFLDYLDFHETSAELLDLKATYLAHVDALTRDRGRGLDFALLPWSTEPPPGFQARIALKLGFARTARRRLSGPRDAPRFEAPSAVEASGGAKAVWPPSEAPAPPPSAGNGPVFAALKQRRAMPPSLLGRGLDRRHYRYIEGRLYLSTGEADKWLDLGTYRDAEAAGRAAAALRHALLDESRAAEGLHVVEHVLLRHRQARETRANLGLAVTMVLPGWTARTARQDFRVFAEETMRAECPAHLVVRCLWLDHPQMVAFEDALECWWSEYRDHATGKSRPTAALDKAADAVLRLIAPAWVGAA